jgi:membrane associated rhomboid family serine protease
MSRNQPGGFVQTFRTHVRILGSFILLLWVIELVDLFLLGGALDRLGIWPRHLIGLRGIVFAPFLHGGLGHLIANTVPLLTLGWFIMLGDISDFFVVSIVTMIVSGLGTWFFGSPFSVHIGASGLVFGYFGFLLSRAYFERSISSIAFSLLAVMLYGSLIWGVFPTNELISWQGHLFGFIGGVLSARMLAKSKL